MRLIIDAFGGDHAPLEVLKGCAMAREIYPEVTYLLAGDTEKIRKTAQENGISLEKMEILDAPDVITMEVHPREIMGKYKNSSMAVGLKALAEGKGDAFLSAGNTGALVVGSTLFVKRIKGIKRAALATVMPAMKGAFMLIDCGANVDCEAEYLQQFGIMGSIYMNKVVGVKNPRVGLANVGTEDIKGGALQQEAFGLLKDSPIHFIGNIEARDIPNGVADVVVADGFTGNVIIKLYEGVAMMLMKSIKGIFYTNWKTKFGAMLLKKEMYALKKKMDYNEYGGAPLLGIAKPVFKAHGSSGARAFCSAIGVTKKCVEGNVIGEITDALAQVKREK